MCDTFQFSGLEAIHPAGLFAILARINQTTSVPTAKLIATAVLLARQREYTKNVCPSPIEDVDEKARWSNVLTRDPLSLTDRQRTGERVSLVLLGKSQGMGFACQA